MLNVEGGGVNETLVEVSSLNDIESNADANANANASYQSALKPEEDTALKSGLDKNHASDQTKSTEEIHDVEEKSYIEKIDENIGRNA